MDATLELEVTNGKLLAFLESNTRISRRDLVDGDRIQVDARMGKQTLASLTRNGQVEIKAAVAANGRGHSGV